MLHRIKTLALTTATLLLLIACGPNTTNTVVASVSQDTVVLVDIDTTPIFGGDTIAIERSVAYITGHFEPSSRTDFVLVDTMVADRAGLYLRKDTYAAFLLMYEAARKDSITLTIRSATRNFNYQKGIWERKWSGQTLLEGKKSAASIIDEKTRALEILKYSSMPGTSRHHWGTDLDLNSFSNTYFEHGEGLKIFNWLSAHAHSFGFCRPYTEKNSDRPNGYQEEKWHWSYWPVSAQLLNAAKIKLNNNLITGFLGADQASTIDVVANYIFGINAHCKLN